MHLRIVVGHNNVSNIQNFLLLLLISEQLRDKIGGAMALVKEFAGICVSQENHSKQSVLPMSLKTVTC
jgi:hypothetical protein